MITNNFNQKKVVITRPKERAEALADIIREKNGQPIIIPTLELKLIESPELKQIIKDIDTYDWIIFTSPAGVKSFFKLYGDKPLNPKIAVIGIKTEEELREHNNTADIIPEKFTAEGLLEVFSQYDLKGSKIALPRTLSARKILPEMLEKFGADVHVAEAYKSDIPQVTDKIVELIDDIIQQKIDIITFTSPLTVINLFEVARYNKPESYDELIDALKNKITVASIGPITGAVLRDENIDVIEPKRYTVRDMINEVLKQID